MKQRFKDKRINAIYQECLRAFNDKDSFLYYKGEPRTGSSGRCNFWNGYKGSGMKPDRGTMGYGYWAAGRDSHQ